MATVPITSGKTVRLAVRDTIRTNLRGYLDAVAVQDGRAAGALPEFRSYVSSFDTDKFQEDQLPTCVIVAPGMAEAPVRRGSGKYEATWAVAVAAVVSGQNRENTFELVELYAAAIRAVLVNGKSLGGIATATEWLDERYDELAFEDLRTIAAGIVHFAVTLEVVISDLGEYGLAEVVTTETYSSS